MTGTTAALPTRLSQGVALIGFLAAAGLAGVLGGLVTIPAIPGWYHALVRPGWTPPDWLFGPVWSALYILMSIAAWLVWRRTATAQGRGIALLLFWIQLVLNGVWSFLFFGLRRPALGVIDILLLLAALAATLIAFWRVRPAAGALMLPYLVWVCYAACLNVAIWRMNG